ncbi:MAG: YwiC-like family protein [Propioniciclava sp.]
MSDSLAAERSVVRKRRRRPPRWVPDQHGAWAMLVVPFVVGSLIRVESREPAAFLIPLLGCWVAGYVAFYTASGWLKAPPARKASWVRPLLVSAALTLGAGMAAVGLSTPRLLWWLPAFVAVLVPSLDLARRRRERHWLGGALTVAAAAMMLLVARYPDPATMVAAADLTPTLVSAGATFAYFFGTVLYVKTNIRERGNHRFLAASVGWHAVAMVAAATVAVAGLATWGWFMFFTATTIRAAVVPRRTPPFSPKALGLAEGALSIALVLLAVLA